MYTALTASSETLAGFVLAELRSDPRLRSFFDAPSGGTMVVTLNTPDEMVELKQEGVSIWLYRVARDEDLLNRPPAPIGRRQFAHTPLPLRLHYLVTPLVARKAALGSALEQTILGKLLQLFHDHPRFRGPQLLGDFTGNTRVELTVRLEPMTLEEITRVWEALTSSYELSVSYEVTVVAIESELVDDVPPVTTAIPISGVIVSNEKVV